MTNSLLKVVAVDQMSHKLF